MKLCILLLLALVLCTLPALSLALEDDHASKVQKTSSRLITLLNMAIFTL